MTVRELMKLLDGMDPDLRVLVDGYEDGLDEPKIRRELAKHCPNDEHWSGDWCESSAPHLGNEETEPGFEPVVVIGR